MIDIILFGLISISVRFGVTYGIFLICVRAYSKILNKNMPNIGKLITLITLTVVITILSLANYQEIAVQGKIYDLREFVILDNNDEAVRVYATVLNADLQNINFELLDTSSITEKELLENSVVGIAKLSDIKSDMAIYGPVIKVVEILKTDPLDKFILERLPNIDKFKVLKYSRGYTKGVMFHLDDQTLLNMWRY